MKVKQYNPQVKVLWSTPNPAEHVAYACSTTQKGVFAEAKQGDFSRLIKFLYSAGHGNPLEHSVISFDISQISRACADQLRTHRTTSPTMSSTHYQDHSDVAIMVPIDAPSELIDQMANSVETYSTSLKNGMSKEDARQLLPLAMEVRYILTINARSLAHLIPLRGCYRNTIETCLLARALWRAAVKWFPELFYGVGTTPCLYGKCTEGGMACNFKERAAQLSKYVPEAR